ncbi:MAG: riboflavin synthase [Alphaproteobacteria bacterium]|nr:riboflavin synthase [Alphaproteobacteria bacterium]MBM3732658.1 riboflavin synthase [Acidimicrobiia bacterium]
MFTGIVSDLGRVRAIKPGVMPSGMRLHDARYEFETGYDTATLALGASVCCSGACLTVIDKGPGWFAATVSAETLARTTLGRWSAGTPVNFERALRAGDELGGHIVTGHVDGVAELKSAREEGGSLRLVFAPPAHLARFIAAKGSVALDGVSLTVNEVAATGFGINLIPHTRAATTLGALALSDAVNLEIDPLAGYVARLLGKD